MDHLPLPHRRNLLARDLQFPLRCVPTIYDGGPLETYPTRRGFHLNYWGEYNFANKLRTPSGARPSVEQTTTLLQEWLFFGLLSTAHDIYGTDYHADDYVKTVGGTIMLTLGILPRHATIWYHLDGARPRQEQKQHYRTLQWHLMRALLFLQNNFTSAVRGKVDLTGEADSTIDDQSRAIVEPGLEVLLFGLVDAMTCAMERICFRPWNHDVDGDSIALSLKSPLHNWCPSERNLMSLTFDNTSFYFVEQLERAEADHGGCNESKCAAFDVVVDDYLPTCTHWPPCRDCRNIAIDQLQLEELLLKDQSIPRVLITIDDPVNVSFTTSGDYVAISHVWSDGLGHPLGLNALPECQIRRLHRLVLETGIKDPVVWIDALCVPAMRGRGKNAALARMADTYRQATSVLVLESDILATSSLASNEELILRIALSKWMRRLWTLEEGVVARSKLLFQCSDRAIVLPEPRQSLTNDIASCAMGLISRYLPEKPEMVAVITSLQFRSTSWKADEPLCIGYIMGIDVTSIIDIAMPKDRMAQLYRLLATHRPRFPWQFLFTGEPKLGIQPFSWAPESLLDLVPQDVSYIQGTVHAMDHLDASQTPRGLQAQCPHSCLLSFPSPISKCMILRIGALWYVVCPVPIGGRCRSSSRFWEGAEKERRLNADPQKDWTECWRARYQEQPAVLWGLVMSNRGSGYGVMVELNEHTEGVIYASLVGQVTMYELRIEHTNIVSGFNDELWGQLGLPMLDEDEVQLAQERVKADILGTGGCYSLVKCEMRLADSTTWCVA